MMEKIKISPLYIRKDEKSNYHCSTLDKGKQQSYNVYTQVTEAESGEMREQHDATPNCILLFYSY